LALVPGPEPGEITGLGWWVGFPHAKPKPGFTQMTGLWLKAARQRQNITKNTRNRFSGHIIELRDSLLLNKPFPQSIQLPKPRSKDGKQKLERNQDLDLQQN
jgi:hypothetical protein